MWTLLSPPAAVHMYPTREDNVLVCSSHKDASYMIAFGYPIMLILVCTVYAVLTRKIPGAFNESQHIGGSEGACDGRFFCFLFSVPVKCIRPASLFSWWETGRPFRIGPSEHRRPQHTEVVGLFPRRGKDRAGWAGQGPFSRTRRDSS